MRKTAILVCAAAALLAGCSASDPMSRRSVLVETGDVPAQCVLSSGGFATSVDSTPGSAMVPYGVRRLDAECRSFRSGMSGSASLEMPPLGAGPFRLRVTMSNAGVAR